MMRQLWKHDKECVLLYYSSYLTALLEYFID